MGPSRAIQRDVGKEDFSERLQSLDVLSHSKRPKGAVQVPPFIDPPLPSYPSYMYLTTAITRSVPYLQR